MSEQPDKSAASQRLVEASRAGDLDAVRRALDEGASADAYVLYDEGNPHSKLSALFFACNEGRTEIARLLLERGADPDDGESVYHAAEYGHLDCLQLLLDHGARLSWVHPHWNNAPLHFLCGYLPNLPHAASALAGTRWLLEHGADPNGKTPKGGEAPLHFVAERGHHLELARLLLAHGADPAQPRDDGRTPWTLAMREGHEKMAALLAAAGAPGDAAPLDRFLGACARGDEAAARAMLAEQPRLLATMTAEDHQVLSRLAAWGNVEGVRTLVALGGELAWENRFGGSALHWAAWHGRADMVRALLALGAPIDQRDTTYGSSPIAWAAHGSTNADHAGGADYVAVVNALLDAHPAREPSINRWGAPPEQFASPAIATLLLERGFTPATE
jgi:ankyrin repeat protein